LKNIRFISIPFRVLSICIGPDQRVRPPPVVPLPLMLNPLLLPWFWRLFCWREFNWLPD
jgi:hypothetical protein